MASPLESVLGLEATQTAESQGVGGATGSQGQGPWHGLEPTGQSSGLDGTAVFWVLGPDGQRKSRISAEEIRRTLEARIQAGQMSPEEVFNYAKRFGFSDGAYGGGKLVLGTFEGRTSTGKTVNADQSGRLVAGGSQGATSQPIPGTVGAALQRQAQGGGGGGGSSITATRTVGGGGVSLQPSRATSTTVQASGGGAGVTGPTSIDPNQPLGLDPRRGAAPGVRGGDPRFLSGTLPTPGSILEGIGPESTLNDVILGMVRRQEANRDAALGVYGGVLDEHRGNPLLQATRARAQDVLDNPFSLDDQTVSRMLGQQGDLIGRNLERLQQQQADRAAASGMGRSGITKAQQDRLSVNAVRQLGDAQRGLLVEQATRRPQELQASLRSAGDFGARDFQQGADVAQRAADQVYGQTSILGDALLSGTLLGGGPPQVNIAARNQYWSGGAHGVY